MKRILSAVLVLLMLSGCSSTENDIQTELKKDIEAAQNIEIPYEIVLVNMYTNYAREYQCEGVFIDKSGNSYSFDFSDDEKMTHEQMLAEMEEIMKSPEMQSNKLFEENEVKYLYSLICTVNENAGFNQEQIMYDYGSRTMYGLRYDENDEIEFVKLYSYGDVVYEPRDGSAEKAYKFYNEKLGINND